jgi:hypothetical protein
VKGEESVFFAPGAIFGSNLANSDSLLHFGRRTANRHIRPSRSSEAPESTSSRQTLGGRVVPAFLRLAVELAIRKDRSKFKPRLFYRLEAWILVSRIFGNICRSTAKHGQLLGHLIWEE